MHPTQHDDRPATVPPRGGFMEAFTGVLRPSPGAVPERQVAVPAAARSAVRPARAYACGTVIDQSAPVAAAREGPAPASAAVEQRGVAIVGGHATCVGRTVVTTRTASAVAELAQVTGPGSANANAHAAAMHAGTILVPGLAGATAWGTVIGAAGWPVALVFHFTQRSTMALDGVDPEGAGYALAQLYVSASQGRDLRAYGCVYGQRHGDGVVRSHATQNAAVAADTAVFQFPFRLGAGDFRFSFNAVAHSHLAGQPIGAVSTAQLAATLDRIDAVDIDGDAIATVRLDDAGNGELDLVNRSLGATGTVRVRTGAR